MAENPTALENSSVEALISMKEGKGNSFHNLPTKRGHPARIRKPNPRIFGMDEDDFRPSPKPKKQIKLSQPSKTSYSSPKPGLSTPNKKAAQAIGVSLRNLLKLPKAHKWVCYEWFYANIDEPLFEGENDFCICLRESFPQLKTRKLTRVQWCKIRRLMGKPRRCSAAFFSEERAALQKKREKMRMLQQRKSTDITDFKDLPGDIAMSLIIGTKVTARLRKPQDGLFTGVIVALDTVNNTYRITFDRPGLGTHSVPDIEVLSNEPQELIPLAAFQPKTRARPPHFTPPRYLPGSSSPGLVSTLQCTKIMLSSRELSLIGWIDFRPRSYYILRNYLMLESARDLEDNDPLLGASPIKGNMLPVEGATYGGFPIKFLVLVTRLSKILAIKRDKIKELKEMNTEAEKLKTYGKSFDMHFQQKYASTVLELERLNSDLNEYLVGVQQSSQEICPEQGVVALDQPLEVQRKCDCDATDLVHKTNLAQGKKMVKNERMLDLICKLTSLLLQIRTFAENDMHSFETKSLQDTLNSIRDCIDPSSISCFQNNVEIHMNHIQSGLSQVGNLSAFAATSVPT